MHRDKTWIETWIEIKVRVTLPLAPVAMDRWQAWH